MQVKPRGISLVRPTSITRWCASREPRSSRRFLPARLYASGLLGNPELWRIISSISPTRIRCSEHHRQPGYIHVSTRDLHPLLPLLLNALTTARTLSSRLSSPLSQRTFYMLRDRNVRQLNACAQKTGSRVMSGVSVTQIRESPFESLIERR